MMMKIGINSRTKEKEGPLNTPVMGWRDWMLVTEGEERREKGKKREKIGENSNGFFFFLLFSFFLLVNKSQRRVRSSLGKQGASLAPRRGLSCV